MKILSIITVLLLSLNTYAQDGADDSSSLEKQLRKRTHAMQWDYSISTSKMTNDQNSNESDTNNGSLNLTYLYNMGRFEVGGQLGASIRKDNTADTETTVSALLAIGHFNFIENTPQNDLIPYIAVGLGVLGGKVKQPGSSTDMNGTGGGLAVGIKWFPLSEIFALTAEFEINSFKLESDSPKVKFDQKGSALSVGWAFYF